MAHNLKLEVFRISLKKRGGSNKNLINFSEFFEKAFEEEDKDKAYIKFVKQYISLFKNEFVLNSDRTKGISATDSNTFIPRSKNNIIDGEIVGGLTGILHTLYKQKDAVVATGNVSTDDVSTLPYYIKIWTPLDHTTGVLMVQSYSNHKVTDLIKFHLSTFFQHYNYSILISPHIPESVKNEFQNNSSVYKVAFVKESLTKDKRRLLNPLFAEFDDLKIRIEVSGFKERAAEFWDKLTGNEKLINSNLEDFDIKENDDFKTIAYYVDEEGYRSNTSIEKNLEIKPTIFLSEDLKLNGSDHFDFEKIKNHTDHLLTEIKKEIGYIK